MYDNEFETRKIKFKSRIKLNHNIYNLLMRRHGTSFYLTDTKKKDVSYLYSNASH